MKSVDNLPVFGLKNLVSGFVISVKILRLKLVRYIADIAGFGFVDFKTKSQKFYGFNFSRLKAGIFNMVRPA
jgi:hypothetical protein